MNADERDDRGVGQELDLAFGDDGYRHPLPDVYDRGYVTLDEAARVFLVHDFVARIRRAKADA